MKVLSFTNQKGGAGKSMMAINVAVAAERTGEKVCIVDLDPQGTIKNWFNTRTAETPLVVAPPEGSGRLVLRVIAGGERGVVRVPPIVERLDRPRP